MRRNFMYCLTDNAGQWWYDFGPKNQSGGWSTPAMLAEAKHLLDLTRACMQQPYEKPSDVLVVYDMTAFNYVRPAKADKLTPVITEALTDTLLGTGAAIDRIFLMDLPRVDLSRYKLVMFGNIFKLDPTERAYIKEHVLRDGRSVVFMSGAGYTDGWKNDVAMISDLAGMRVEKAAKPDPALTVTLEGQTYPLDAKGVVSLFTVAGDGAQALGKYASGEMGAAVKTIHGAKVYYFGLPLAASLDFFKALLAQAGVHSYVGNTVQRDYVAVGGGIIGIYSVAGGEKIIQSLNGRTRTVVMPPFSAQYFDLHTGGCK
jgi:hypothetical protein